MPRGRVGTPEDIAGLAIFLASRAGAFTVGARHHLRRRHRRLLTKAAIANGAALLARIGADARDDEELRQKKALLVLLAVLILPVSVVWGSLYLGFGSPVGVVPFVYFAVSLGSLVVFARTRRFQPLLVTQLLDILLTTTAGQMLVGGFLPSGGVGLWGILAPLGALVFLEVRQAVRWFVAFVVVFLLTGLAGEVFVLGRGSPGLVHEHDAGVERHRYRLRRLHAPRVLRPPAQRGADGTPSRAGEVRSPPPEHPAAPDRRATEGRRPDDRRPLRRGLHPLRRRRRTSPRSRSASRRPRWSASSISSSPISTCSWSGTGSRRSRRSAIATWRPRACRIRVRTTRAGLRSWRWTCETWSRPRRWPASPVSS